MTTYTQELKDELHMQREFESLDEIAVLSFVYTDTHFKKLSYSFFSNYSLTDVQFNILMILWDRKGEHLRQFELADLLVVNRASLGGVIDTMVTRGLVERQPDPVDRRAKVVAMTVKGNKLYKEVRTPYYEQMKELLSVLSNKDKIDLIQIMSKLRTAIKNK